MNPIILNAMNYQTKQGFSFIIIATLLWATAAPIAKYLFNNGILPADLVQARVSYSFLILVVILGLFKREFLVIAVQDIPYFAVLGIGGFAFVQYTYFAAISRIDVGIAIALQYTAPSMILGYSIIFLGKKIRVATVIAVGLALLGCYLVIGANEADLSTVNWEGILWALASAVTFAFYTLYGEKGIQKYTPWTVFFYAVFFAAIFWNLIHPPFILVGKGFSWMVWMAILAVAIMGTLIPFALFFMALKKLDPIRLTVTSTLEPIFATGMAFLMLGETLSMLQIFGGGLILISVILMALMESK